MSIALGLRLLASSAVHRRDIEGALLAHAGEGVPFIRALLDSGAIDAEALEQELARSDLPFLRTVVAVPLLARTLPKGLCRRLLAIPVRRDPYTGTVDVAVVDPFEPHIATELAHHLGTGVRLVRASLRAVEDAIAAFEKNERQRSGSDFMPEEPGSEAPSAADADADDEEVEVAAPTRRGPFSPRAPLPPFADLSPFLDRIRRARDRDAVVEALVRGMQTIAHRVGVLVVKKGELTGWACNPELADIDAFRGLRLPPAGEGVLATAMASGTYLGPLPPTAENGALLAVLKEPTNDVAITVVGVGGRPALLLLADELGDTLIATKRAARLAKVASEVLTQLVREQAR